MRSRLVIAAALVLAGCPGLGDEQAPVLAVVPAHPTYEQDIRLVFDFYCTDCHGDPPAVGAPISFRLDRWDPVDRVVGVAQMIDLIDDRAIKERSMPPIGQPSLADNDWEALARWIEEGAPRE